MSFCAKACSRLTRVSQLASRQIHAAADPHRRNARHVGAVGEGGAHDVELVLDAPDAAVTSARHRLALEFAAAENRVALRIDRLLQLAAVRIAAVDASVVVAGVAGQPAEDEAVELRVVGGELRSGTARSPAAGRPRPISRFRCSRLGLPMSKVAVASWAPRENSSAGFGARSTYCAVMLATRSHGRFWIRPTLALFGVKCRLRGVAGRCCGSPSTSNTSGMNAGVVP